MTPRAKLTWERLAESLPLLNVSEIARQADVARHRLVDAQRGKARLTEEELARIAGIVRKLNLRTNAKRR